MKSSFVIILMICCLQEISLAQTPGLNFDTDRNRQTVAKIVSYDIEGIELSNGTGVVVRSNGIIATCNHVIMGACSVEVHINSKIYPVTSYSSDIKNDLALLNVNTNLPSIRFSNSEQLIDNEQVQIIGYPAGIRTLITTDGQIRRKHVNIYEINANVSPGNSGSPVFNSSGEFIGIVYAHYPNTLITYVLNSEIIENKLSENISEIFDCRNCDNLNVLFNKGVESYSNGRYAQSLKFFNIVISCKGKYYADGLKRIGDIYFKFDNYQKALYFFELALNNKNSFIYSTELDVFYSLGLSNLLSKQCDKAKYFLMKCYEMDNNSCKPAYFLYLTSLCLDEYAKTIKFFWEAYNCQKELLKECSWADLADSFYHLYLLDTTRQNYKDSSDKYFNRAIEMGCTNFDTYYMQWENNPSSTDRMMILFRNMNLNYDQWFTIGMKCFENEQFDYAFEAFSQAEKSNDMNIQNPASQNKCLSRYNMAHKLYKDKRYFEVIDLFRADTICIHNEKIQELLSLSHYFIGEQYFEQGLRLIAAEESTGLIEILNLGIEYFNNCLNYNNQDYDAFYHLGLIYLLLENCNKALTAFKEASKVSHSDKQNVNVIINLSRTFVCLSQLDSAINNFAPILQITDNVILNDNLSDNVSFYLSDLFGLYSSEFNENSKLLDYIISICNHYIQIFPNQSSFKYYKAKALMYQGDLIIEEKSYQQNTNKYLRALNKYHESAYFFKTIKNSYDRGSLARKFGELYYSIALAHGNIPRYPDNNANSMDSIRNNLEFSDKEFMSIISDKRYADEYIKSMHMKVLEILIGKYINMIKPDNPEQVRYSRLALDASQRAVELYSYNGYLQSLRGVALYKNNNFEKAEGFLKKSIEIIETQIEPFYEARYYLAIVYYKLKDNKKSCENYNVIIGNPDGQADPEKLLYEINQYCK